MTWASASKTLNPLRMRFPPSGAASPPSVGCDAMRRVHTLVDGLRFAEGLRWHRDRLWFSDMLDKTVYRCSTGGDIEVVATGIDQPSGLGFRPEGLLLVERGTG